jgi:hypothetical protein
MADRQLYAFAFQVTKLFPAILQLFDFVQNIPVLTRKNRSLKHKILTSNQLCRGDCCV